MVKKTLTDEQRTLLEDLLKGKVEDIEEGTEKAREILQEILGSKAEISDTDVVVTLENDSNLMKMLNEAFAEVGNQFKALYAELAAVKSRLEVTDVTLKALQTSEDEKISEAFTGTDWAAAFRSVAEKGDAQEEADDAEKIEQLKAQIKTGVVEKTTDVTAENPLAYAVKQMVSMG